MKCPYCHRDIHGDYVTVKVDGKFVPAHRDCHPGKTERPPYRQKKPRCRITKALKNYRNDHGG